MLLRTPPIGHFGRASMAGAPYLASHVFEAPTLALSPMSAAHCTLHRHEWLSYGGLAASRIIRPLSAAPVIGDRSSRTVRVDLPSGRKPPPPGTARQGSAVSTCRSYWICSNASIDRTGCAQILQASAFLGSRHESFRVRNVVARVGKHFDVIESYRNRDWNPSQDFVLRSKRTARREHGGD